MEILEMPHLCTKSLKVNAINISENCRDVLEIIVQGSLKKIRKSEYIDLYDGYDITINEILDMVKSNNITTVVIKGGEPVLQAKNICSLLRELKINKTTSIIETYFNKKEIENGANYNKYINGLLNLSDKVCYKDLDGKNGSNVIKNRNIKFNISKVNIDREKEIKLIKSIGIANLLNISEIL